MGKNKVNKTDLGRALVKSRFGNKSGRKFVGDGTILHTTELQDGSERNPHNLQSVTEQSTFEEFIASAELADEEFQSERPTFRLLTSKNVGLLTKAEIEQKKDVHDKHRSLLKIPRRPKWDASTTPEELDRAEKDSFLEWRRSLAQLQEEEGILLTPYEKNLEFWRQLWRVVERSDVVVQIVDARNPLLFRCEDLEAFVKEVSLDKMNVILINKADFLTELQRQQWADYFTSIKVKVIFYSAVASVSEEEEEETSNSSDSEKVKDLEAHIKELKEDVETIGEKLTKILSMAGIDDEINSNEILTQNQLIELFRNIHKGPKVKENVTTIGLVGYPNVGKSSTINSLFSVKKVSVSATPGKTKHFQTLFLENDILLCDCPGLVMPSFVLTKAEMVINGILPIDHLTDHVPSVTLVATLIPKYVIEDKYGIMLPSSETDDSPTSEELLNSYGYNRGFMTANGQPDNPRSARYILKDFMNGHLLYCHSPPNVKQEDYHSWPERTKISPSSRTLTPAFQRAIKPIQKPKEEIDKSTYQRIGSGVHVAAPNTHNGYSVNLMGGQLIGEKPHKMRIKRDRKENVKFTKKKEKLRRVYADLDRH